jgi:hypothetical protein
LLIEKLLLAPTEQLKSVRDEAMVAAYADAVRQLFKLSEDASAPGRKPANVATLRRE